MDRIPRRRRQLAKLAASFAAITLCAPAAAAPFDSFEGGAGAWLTLGDVTLVDTTFDANIPDGNWGLLLTTYPLPGGSQLDPLWNDPLATPVSPAASADLLEAFLGLPANALDGPFSPSGNDATEGSAVTRGLNVAQTFTLRFEFNLFTNETDVWAPDYRDYFFTTLTGQPNTVQADVFANPLVASATVFDRETGWGMIEWVDLAPGAYTLGIGLVDVLDADLGSALLIDNVQLIPEPRVALLLGTGLAGIWLAGRPRR